MMVSAECQDDPVPFALCNDIGKNLLFNALFLKIIFANAILFEKAIFLKHIKKF
jgi:hypothetical protein